MHEVMPDNYNTLKKRTNETSEESTLSLLLGADNEIVYYRGREEATKVATNKIDNRKLGHKEQVLNDKKEILVQTKGTDMIVLNKPDAQSVTRNLVDVLDEVQKTGVKRYMITKISDAERKMM